MKKTDAHAIVANALQAYLNILAKDHMQAAQSLRDDLAAAMQVLAPVPDGPAIVGDPPGATNG